MVLIREVRAEATATAKILIIVSSLTQLKSKNHLRAAIPWPASPLLQVTAPSFGLEAQFPQHRLH